MFFVVRYLRFGLLLWAWPTSLALAQSGGGFEITRSTLDAGGGISTGGGFRLGGTMGQPEPGGAMTGGGFTMTGGFWSPVTAGSMEPPTVGDNTCQTAGADTAIPCSTDADCTEPAECGLKSRYISITPANPSTATSIRVRVLTAPQFPGIVGHIFYAGPEHSIPNAPNPAQRGAPLQCTATPHSQVWTTGPLHLWGASVVPTTNTRGITTYGVAHCDVNGDNCSAELQVEMAKWGDAVRPFTGGSQPNFGDVNSIVQKFSALASAPSMPRADIVGPQAPGTPNTPNQGTNFADVSNDVSAFSGFPYPYAVSACP